MSPLIMSFVVLFCMCTLFYVNAALSVWAISVFSGLLVYSYANGLSIGNIITWICALAIFAPLLILPLRRKYITGAVFKLFKKIKPNMSTTEKEALEAGSITWEGDLFSGNPDFQKLLSMKPASINEEEQAFLDNEVNTLCSMLNEWEITHHQLDLPSKVWQYLKDEGFLGLIIPKEYGGRALSATAVSKVQIKIYSKSISCASTVSVPNSLGPAELLLKYGTEDQKNYYLPRLAKGIEIPCFALTGPNAGSDAASLPDIGIICKGDFKGEEVIGIRLNWNKRYITLAPVATVLGLAFRLFDPDGLIGATEDIGITCALIPVDTKGVVTGRRHFPLNTAFLNGPTQGKDVFIPLEYVIGGQAMVGQGWRMLVECLSAGRAVSLPSSAVGGCKTAAVSTGAYARVRKQFNMAIANFEGIEEPLARIASETYVAEAATAMTIARIDEGEEPAVASAILKYHTTEAARRVGIDAMDIHGGKGICMGPNNYLARGYQNAPISITVEGANILTRCLIIFGQGAVRCHPYVLDELEATENNDLKRFDKAIMGHVGHFISNSVRSILLGITDGHLKRYHKDDLKRPVQMMVRYSANLAFLADFSMFVLGANLKIRERISARLADILSMLYLCSATIKRFHDDGRPQEDWALVKWSYSNLLHCLEQNMYEAIDNFPARWARVLLKVILFPTGRRRKPPRDRIGSSVAKSISTPCSTRERLASGLYWQNDGENNLANIEQAFQQIVACEAIEKKILGLFKEGKLSSLTLLNQIDEAVEQSLLSAEDAALMRQAELSRQKVIAVDDFSQEELMRRGESTIVKSKVKNLKEVKAS